MAQVRQVSFFNSITTKIIFALIFAFGLVVALVFYVVNNEGYEKIRNETDKLLIEKGESAVDFISFDIKSVMRSAAELRDTSQILPLEEQKYQSLLNSVFDEDVISLLGSGGIWPKAFALDAETRAVPMTRLRTDDGYVAISADNDNVKNYLEAPWFSLVQALNPDSCLWNNVVASQTGNELAISCGLAINRDGEFWGVTTVNFTLDSIQENLETLNEQLGEGYALLVDNSNQMVASSNPELLPYLGQDGRPIKLDEWVEDNPAWQPVLRTINQERQKAIDSLDGQIPAELVKQFNAYDMSMQTYEGSMLINYANFSKNQNEYTGNTSNNFLGLFELTGDSIYRDESVAYVFTVPETSWKLVIVKPLNDVNSIADGLSKDLIKYLMFALIGTAAIIFFLLDFLALRPLQQTSESILKADTLIDANRYNELNMVQFDNTGNDEIGIVNSSIRDMLMRIEENEGQLANINQQLEVKVEERTAELQNTLKELKNSQLQLVRSEKMATLGQMVAGVAHEVNTPLSYVQNNLEIIGQLTEQYEEIIAKVGELKTTMLSEQSADEEVEQLLGEIMATADEIEEDNLSEELRELLKDSLFGVEQITDMVLNLRNFARLDESKVKKINIQECIESSLKIARNSIKTHNVVTKFNETPEVTCSPSQINQVLVNLFNNASQAMSHKTDGKISIATHHDRDHVYVDVKDNGIGMSEETLSQIFEPFFTTKGAGEGTGLGMAISQQIMEQHGGSIQAKSKEGMGTVFRLTLPIDGTVIQTNTAG